MTGRIVLASKERPGQRHTDCRAVHLYCCSCRSLRDPHADPRRVHPWRLRLQDCPLRKSQIARPRLRELEVEAHAAHSEPSRGTIDRNPRCWIRAVHAESPQPSAAYVSSGQQKTIQAGRVGQPWLTVHDPAADSAARHRVELVKHGRHQDAVVQQGWVGQTPPPVNGRPSESNSPSRSLLHSRVEKEESICHQAHVEQLLHPQRPVGSRPRSATLGVETY